MNISLENQHFHLGLVNNLQYIRNIKDVEKSTCYLNLVSTRNKFYGTEDIFDFE